jgi:hypothetical protein
MGDDEGEVETDGCGDLMKAERRKVGAAAAAAANKHTIVKWERSKNQVIIENVQMFPREREDNFPPLISTSYCSFQPETFP